MRLIATDHPDVKIVEPRVHGDGRGFFMESWNAREFGAAGIADGFVQDNHSRSARGVVRGLHYQVRLPQGKLLRVTAGRAFDVAVDLRRSSPRFGQWVGCELSADNRHILWVPEGFAHGFLALEDGTEILYKCTDYYAPEHERALLWSDPAIGIDWPLGEIAEPVLSPRDSAAPPLAEAETYE